MRELGTLPLDGFIGPAHVTTVIGSRPYELFAERVPQAGGDRRLRAAGRDAGHPDAGAPAQRGPRRGRERVHPRRDPRGQPQGPGAGGRGVRAATQLRVARPGRGALQRRCASARPTPPSTPSGASAWRTQPVAGQQGLRVRRDPARRQATHGLQAVRHRAARRRIPIGSCMVSSEGACAAYYTYGRFREPCSSDAARPCRTLQHETAPSAGRATSRPLDLKHGRVDMTHGARRPRHGAADRAAVRRRVRQRLARAGDNDQACCRSPSGAHGDVAPTATWSRPLFFPGGDIGCLSVHGTVNDVAMAGARPLYLAAGLHPRGGLSAGRPARIVESMAAARRARPACRSSPATPRWSSRARATACSSPPPASAWCRRASQISGDRARPGDRILVSGTIGDHGMAIMSQRESLTFGTDLLSDTAALHGLVAAMLDAVPEHPRAARPDARRPGHDAERDRRAVRRRHADRRSGHPGARRGARRRASFSASTRCTWPTRASWWRSCRRGRRAPARGHARPPAGPHRRR